MSSLPARLQVWVGDRDVWVKITGRATFTSGPDFKTLVSELHQKGYRRFVLDVSECMLMDSTFLGLLCGLGMKLHNAGGADAGVEILNPSPRVAELLESLGVCSIIKIVSAAVPSPPTGEATVAESQSPTREEIAQTSLEAHKILMSLSAENAAKFKDVAQFLAEDLKRIREAS